MLSAPASVANIGRAKRIKHSMDRKSMTRNFLTGSRFEGTWTDDLRTMDGLGEYTYPDGTIYRGYFDRGCFHGRGTMIFPKPYSCTIRGEFNQGSLTSIHDMYFSDGLQVETQLNGELLDFNKWMYCTTRDRRFLIEYKKGIPPVGPMSNISASSPVRELSNDTYDLVGGVYDWNTGVIKYRPPPFSLLYAVCCPGYRNWVQEECRHSKSRPIVITPQRFQNIMRNNLETERDIAEYDTSCDFDQDALRMQYFNNMCKRKDSSETANDEGQEEEQEDEFTVQSDLSIDDYAYSDTETSSSFSISSTILDILPQKFKRLLISHRRRILKLARAQRKGYIPRYDTDH